jgi:hypothetical protein
MEVQDKRQLSLLGDIMIRPWLCRLIRDEGKHVSLSTKSNVEKYHPNISRPVKSSPEEDYTTAIKIIFSHFTNCTNEVVSLNANARFDHASVSFDGTVIASVEIPTESGVEIPLSSISGYILLKTNEATIVEFVADSTELTEICLLSEGITDVVVP